MKAEKTIKDLNNEIQLIIEKDPKGYYSQFTITSLKGEFSPFYLHVFYAPTHNCQILSLAGIETIMNNYKYISAETLNDMFYMFLTFSAKKLWLIDIHQIYLSALNNFLAKVNNKKFSLNIFTQTDFRSTNGSLRSLIMLKANWN